MPNQYQTFGVSIIFVIILPFLPLILEYYLSSGLSYKSLTIAAAIYSISIGISSSSKLLFAIGVVASIFFSASFGSAFKEGVEGNYLIPLIGVLFISVVHMVERWNRHVGNAENFLEFK